MAFLLSPEKKEKVIEPSMVTNDLLGLNAATVNYTDLAINMLVALLLAVIIRFVYIRYGTSLANKYGFSRIFIPLTLTTLLIISVVKSSLALSLGLVGALSIVRFRTAIKDPEELIYLLICIGVGLGLGADQRKLTVVVSVVTLAALVVSTFFSKRKSTQKGWYVILKSRDAANLSENRIMEQLADMKNEVDIKRLALSGENAEICLLMRNLKTEAIESVRHKLQALMPGSEISMLEHES